MGKGRCLAFLLPPGAVGVGSEHRKWCQFTVHTCVTFLADRGSWLELCRGLDWPRWFQTWDKKVRGIIGALLLVTPKDVPQIWVSVHLVSIYTAIVWDFGPQAHSGLSGGRHARADLF